MNNKTYKTSDIVIGAVFLIWFLCSIFMLVMNADTNLKVIPIIFGHIFIVIGVLILADMRKKGNFSSIILLVLIIGVEMFIGGLAVRFGGEVLKNIVKEWVLYFFFSAFSLFGVFGAIDFSMSKQRRKNAQLL